MAAPDRSELTGVLLAGGDGTRLGGVAKGRLRKDGRTLAERTLDVLRPLTARQVVLANGADYDDLGLPVHRDLRVGQGPLAGLETALWAISTPFALVLACDMPSPVPAVLDLLARRDSAYAAVVPRVRGRAEPLCARYSRRLLDPIGRALDAGGRGVAAFLRTIDVDWIDEEALRGVDPTLATFENANTPEDLTRLGIELP